MNRVYRGPLDANQTNLDNRNAFIKLWCHEIFSVFADGLVDAEDKQLFDRLRQTQLNAALSTTFNALFRDAGEPTPHVTSAQDGVREPYREYADGEYLQRCLVTQLEDYNDTGNSVPMNLGLFREAIYHVCMIVCTIGRQFGHALPIGLSVSGDRASRGWRPIPRYITST